nr:methyltransferase [Azospirillum picis]
MAVPDPEQLFRYGYERLYAGDFPGAVRGFHKVCAADPANGEAWAALGDAAAGLDGDPGQRDAAAAYRRAVAIEPLNWSWRLQLAEVMLRCGETAIALSIYDALKSERSDSAAVRLGLGHCLDGLGRRDEALEEYREAVTLRPDDREAALALGNALQAAGDALASVELLQPLARRYEEDAVIHHALGRGWLALREPAKALAALRRARVNADAGEVVAIDRLIAMTEAGGDSDLSAAYVRALFDRYAERFDKDLVGRLGYAAPDLLRNAVDRVVPVRHGLRILDLGCGTGLAGVVFRGLADPAAAPVAGRAGRLAGVDLSPRMVEKARQRGLYDDLWVGDVIEAMERDLGAWDLLVAADVLVYLGDLTPVFAAAAHALAPGGWFAATAERLPKDGEPFLLGDTRRYAHAEAHVRSSAEAAGFTVRLMEPCTPRRERGGPVPGLLFVVQRAGG